MPQSDQIRTLPERPPEVGELVQVRSRRWLVEEVTPSEIPGASSLVTLACADDDAQGQALRIFWDYEIDRRILEEEGWAHLAERGFDDAHQFAAFLHTLRWHCVTATDANLFQAPFRAGIRIDAYQMEPLRKDAPICQERVGTPPRAELDLKWSGQKAHGRRRGISRGRTRVGDPDRRCRLPSSPAFVQRQVVRAAER